MNEKSVIEEILSKMIIVPMNSTLMDQRESGQLHMSYQQEQKIRNCFKTGDMDGYRRVIGELQNGTIPVALGEVSDDRLRMIKYACITYGAICVRASIEGGVPEIYAYHVSDQFIQLIDQASTVSQLNNAFLILRKLIIAVQNLYRSNTTNTIICKCENYICNHLHDHLRRDDLAHYCGISPSYLSSLFHKETGKTLTQYIQSQKILSAKNMLLVTDMAYSEISYYLGFSSQSHFSMVFRKATGLSPSAYRKQQ